MISSDVVALIAAGATTISAIFIAWQANETRKTAKSSEKAAKASQDALEIANGALEQARKQSSQSALMVKDAMRARLDTNAPRVSMVPVEGRGWPGGFRWEKAGEEKARKFVNLSDGENFTLPEDNNGNHSGGFGGWRRASLTCAAGGGC